MIGTTNVYYLSNKIPVIVCDAEFQTCRILISLDFGARDENENEYGITHFIEHLLGQSVIGNGTFNDLKKKIEILGGDINLYTTHTKVCLGINVIPDNLNKVIKIITPQIMTPLFDSQKIEKEKNIILDEYKRSIDSRYWTLFKYENLLKNTGFGHHILGTPKTIQSFTKDILSNYYFSHLSNDKINIVFVGQINDKENLLYELEQGFGKMSTVSYEHKIYPIQQVVAQKLKPDAKNIKLTLAFAPKISTERKNQLAIGIFRTILQKRLIESLRFEKGFVYAITCSTMGDINTKLYTIETECSPQNIDNIIKDIAVICKNFVKSEPITAEELQVAKNVFKYSLLREMDSIDAICAHYAQHMTCYGTLYDVDVDKQTLDNLTLQDIMIIGKTLLNAPFSGVTYGAAHGCDVIDVWNKNFT